MLNARDAFILALLMHSKTRILASVCIRLLQRADPSAIQWIMSSVLALALMTGSAKVEFVLLSCRKQQAFFVLAVIEINDVLRE